MTSAIGPNLAIWGTFDVDSFGDHLYPRIFELEMRRRLPTARVRAFSPLGYLHPVPFDGGFVVEPLGEWSSERQVELARSIDLVAIGGGDLIHMRDDAYSADYGIDVGDAERLRPSAYFVDGLGPALEEGCPVVWHSVGIPSDLDEKAAARVRSALEKRTYVSVRDEISHERLLQAGVTREVAVIPDSAFIAERVIGDEQLERRLAYLRGIESYPPSDRPLVVQGSEALLPYLEEIARALGDATAEVGSAPIVLLETGRRDGDERFAEALAPHLSGHVQRMPASATVEDIFAAIAHARGFVGDSLRGNEIAFAAGLPIAVLDLGAGESKLAGFAAVTGCEDALVRSPGELLPAIIRVLSGKSPRDGRREIAGRIDSHFDSLAEIAERAASQRAESSPLARRSPVANALDEPREREATLRRAFVGRGHRLVEQRLRLGLEVERLERALAESENRERGLEEQCRQYEIQVEGLRSALDGLVNSRTFRYTAPLRAIFGRLRRTAK